MAQAARKASQYLATCSTESKNSALQRIVDNLTAKREAILSANKDDMEQAVISKLSGPLVQRLSLEKKFDDVVEGVRQVIKLPDPVGMIQAQRLLDENLMLTRLTVPIGVIGVIFESRPDALVQIATLCLKSGNAAILKGGREASRTNAALFAAIDEAIGTHEAFKGALHLAETRAEIKSLLALDNLVDLIIPRGSNDLVREIKNATSIPVLGHADGICHVYVDRNADIKMATRITRDAKIQSPAVCNACETLLVHAEIASQFLPAVVDELSVSGVEIRGDAATLSLVDGRPCSPIDWDTEYLDLILSIKVVADLWEAIEFINVHGSHHTDAIITGDQKAADTFLSHVDSATVLWNASTRFADGFRFGMGAEVGISTNRIHARGPVGLDGLVSYKYKVFGDGQVVGDYVSGKSSFNFTEIAP